MGKRNYGCVRRATRSHGDRDQCLPGRTASSSLIPNRRTLGLRATKQKFIGPYSQRIACELIDVSGPLGTGPLRSLADALKSIRLAELNLSVSQGLRRKTLSV